MFVKGFGIVMIVTSCSVIGFRMAGSHRKELRSIRTMIALLDYIACELHYRMTSLPDLCRQASGQDNGCVGKLFRLLAEELEDQISPDVNRCMSAAVVRCPELPPVTRECFQALGASLGRFDLEGQLEGLESVRQLCRQRLSELEHNKDARVRSYQTLGLCAGAALAILLI